ncbi:Membrane dipeptidase (Peptidase family M19) [Paraliobacillus sp. PM-2]|uniref:dipeptidase n=1 Tax=Paraliobacillus sp. PM-2 TaxID=1462524 RepID=UPI00061BCDF3|nr:membrane dipeptidase [Paraliobacillus sp. PM-2]CQR47621.1 Membrane dipeptidase (Peptidase family M19) [Paraliobacillus sp. PM-2]
MIIDAHCDVLLKLWSDNLDFKTSEKLQVNLKKWRESPVKVQCFAIFVPAEVKEERRFQVALEMITIFFEKIIEPYEDIKFIANKGDLESLKENERGAMLTLEGCHVIGDDINKLKTLLRLGVRAVGLTWNQANAVADGIGEKRGAGLSSFGEEVVALLNQENIWVDVSHLSYQGFFDVMKQAKYVMASHANVLHLCSHPRNLDHEQIQAIIHKNGWIGVTFVPFFTKEQQTVTYYDTIQHVLAYIHAGAETCLGFGSDFDGIDQYIVGLESMEGYRILSDELKNKLTERQWKNIAYQNFINKFPRIN